MRTRPLRKRSPLEKPQPPKLYRLLAAGAASNVGLLPFLGGVASDCDQCQIQSLRRRPAAPPVISSRKEHAPPAVSRSPPDGQLRPLERPSSVAGGGGGRGTPGSPSHLLGAQRSRSPGQCAAGPDTARCRPRAAVGGKGGGLPRARPSPWAPLASPPRRSQSRPSGGPFKEERGARRR